MKSRTYTRVVVAVVALLAVVTVVAGGIVGLDRLVSDDASGSSAAPERPSSPTPTTPTGEPLEVSGSGVGTEPFGSDAGEVVAAVTARLGEPDAVVGPQRYARVPGSRAWRADPDDPLSPSWPYPVASASCWGVLCLTFGGDTADALQLRGWQLVLRGGESGSAGGTAVPRPDVRLAGTGIHLGDSWARLHAAYPKTTVHGAEGASLAVWDTPWAGVSDGVGAWRLSGAWDYTRPTRVPPGAVVTRLSGGEGPEPGCC